MLKQLKAPCGHITLHFANMKFMFIITIRTFISELVLVSVAGCCCRSSVMFISQSCMMHSPDHMTWGSCWDGWMSMYSHASPCRTLKSHGQAKIQSLISICFYFYWQIYIDNMHSLSDLSIYCWAEKDLMPCAHTMTLCTIQTII